MADYLLPSHPDVKVLDRFDIVELDVSDNSDVPLWKLIQALHLEAVDSTHALVSALEIIDITLWGASRTDFGTLRRKLDQAWSVESDFWGMRWPNVVDIALEMPKLFPSNKISILTPENPHVILSRRQVACLVIHQFLLTLLRPSWMTGSPRDSFSDFHIWYDKDLAFPEVANAYLDSLIIYLTRVGKQEDAIVNSAWPLHFFLHSWAVRTGLPSSSSRPMSSLEIICPDEVSTDADFLGLPNGACVIFANRQIGHGECGTQEETWMGGSPEACVAELMTPPLLDNQALVIKGAEPMISTVGYGRAAKLKEVLKPMPAGDLIYAQRTMLFMDALEIDCMEASEDVLLDMIPDHMSRELAKATLAFSAYIGLDQAIYDNIVTGLWGCGAFGGNPYVKILIQWLASSHVGIARLTVVLPGSRYAILAAELRKFVASVASEDISYAHINAALRQPELADACLWQTEGGPLQKLLNRLRTGHVSE